MTAPAAWLLDASVVSEMMRPYPEPRVAYFLDAIASGGIAIATITVWEILNGIGRLNPGRRREAPSSPAPNQHHHRHYPT